MKTKNKVLIDRQEAVLIIYALRDSAFQNEIEDMQKRATDLRKKVSELFVK